MLNRRDMLASLGALLGSARSSSAQPPTRSQFIGDARFRLVDEEGESRFELLSDFGYIDSKGIRWQAKPGLLTDGASIPRVFWPVVGHPYEGLYVKAAIIHDYYCIPENRYRRWQDVHEVFHDAMKANGVGRVKALLMFFAVRRFGPRWKVTDIKPCTPTATNFCASATVTEYQIQSEAVSSFDEAQEKQLLAEVERVLLADELSEDDVVALEERQPALSRMRSLQTVDAESEKGWFFKNPNKFPIGK